MKPKNLKWARLSDNSGEYCEIGDYEIGVSPLFPDKRRFKPPYRIDVYVLDPKDSNIIRDIVSDSRERPTLTEARRAVLSLYRWARRNAVDNAGKTG